MAAGHVNEKKERCQHGDPPHAGNDEDDLCKPHTDLDSGDEPAPASARVASQINVAETLALPLVPIPFPIRQEQAASPDPDPPAEAHGGPQSCDFPGSSEGRTRPGTERSAAAYTAGR